MRHNNVKPQASKYTFSKEKKISSEFIKMGCHIHRGLESSYLHKMRKNNKIYSPKSFVILFDL